jgi:hypothetical protein
VDPCGCRHTVPGVVVAPNVLGVDSLEEALGLVADAGGDRSYILAGRSGLGAGVLPKGGALAGPERLIG